MLNLLSSLPYTEPTNNLLIEQLNLSLGCFPLGKSVECISKYTWEKHQVRQRGIGEIFYYLSLCSPCRESIPWKEVLSEQLINQMTQTPQNTVDWVRHSNQT